MVMPMGRARRSRVTQLFRRRSLMGADSGATAVEFALVAAPFIALQPNHIIPKTGRRIFPRWGLPIQSTRMMLNRLANFGFLHTRFRGCAAAARPTKAAGPCPVGRISARRNGRARFFMSIGLRHLMVEISRMPLPPTPILVTDRLVLRPLQEQDALATQRLFPQSEDVRRLTASIPWPYPPDGAAMNMSETLAQRALVKNSSRRSP